MRPMLNGQVFPTGVGNTEGVKQNAAKNALRSEKENENPGPVVRLSFIFIKQVYVCVTLPSL